MADTAMTFESAMSRLEKIVGQMEAGEHTLAESLSLYEEGVGLMQFCAAALDKAEQKVSLLTLEPTGELAEVPFSAE